MKDDSGSYAVFTEQGSSASQMTAAKIMDIISRLPGSPGCINKRAGGKRVCGGFGSKYAYGQQERP